MHFRRSRMDLKATKDTFRILIACYCIVVSFAESGQGTTRPPFSSSLPPPATDPTTAPTPTPTPTPTDAHTEPPTDAPATAPPETPPQLQSGPRQSLFGALPPQINGTFVQPSGPRERLGNNPAKCDEVRRSNLNNAILFMRHLGLIAEREGEYSVKSSLKSQSVRYLVSFFPDVSFRRTISSLDIEGSNKQFGCAPQQDFTDCNRNLCYNLRYRTMDGSCNNLENPFFGASAIPYVRTKAPIYDDGIGAPTCKYCITRSTYA